MFLLLLAACLTDPAATATADAAETSEGAKGMSARFVTVDVELGDDLAEYPVDTPKNGTFVRVDACTRGSQLVCDQWEGGYLLPEDGALVLTPSAWDGTVARVTFLVIE